MLRYAQHEPGVELVLLHMKNSRFGSLLLLAAMFVAPITSAATFTFTTGSPNGQMATASRPALSGVLEIESGDDFILSSRTAIGHATFVGLLPSGANLNTANRVVVKIYRIFPFDSTIPPSGNVPTRTNSPADVALAIRDSAAGQAQFSASILSDNFTAANSVVNGINKVPNQTTGGEGPVSGEEVQFDVTFAPAFLLPAGHYFFVPQVGLTTGTFVWLSGQRPAPTPFTGDLQSWIRNGNLDPDWLRIGTDIVGGMTPPTFNGTFSLSGVVIVKSDLDGDGKSDIVLRNSSSADVAGYRMNGTAIVSAAVAGNSGATTTLATVGDCDGDGKADVILQNASTNDVLVWLMNGNSISSTALVGNPGNGWKVVGSADFNADGKADLVLQNQNTHDVAIWLMNGTSILGGAVVGSPGTSYVVVGAGDFDGDGNSDILLQNPSTGDFAEWQMNGLTIIAGAAFAGAGPSWKAKAVADSDSNGRSDIFLRNDASGDVAVWMMNGFTIAGGLLVGSPGPSFDLIGAADYDGDGKADVLLRNPTTGDIAIWLLNSGVIVNGAIVSTPGPAWVPIGN
jgi:FG-GAP-like repeat